MSKYESTSTLFDIQCCQSVIMCRRDSVLLIIYKGYTIYQFAVYMIQDM